MHGLCVCIVVCSVWHAIALKSAVEMYKSKWPFSRAFTWYSTYFKWNETNEKSTNKHTRAHTSSAHISFVLSWRFPWCLYFFHSYLNIEHNNFSIARRERETHTIRVYTLHVKETVKSVDSMCIFLYTTIFLFVACFSQTFTFFGRFSRDGFFSGCFSGIFP